MHAIAPLNAARSVAVTTSAPFFMPALRPAAVPSLSQELIRKRMLKRMRARMVNIIYGDPVDAVTDRDIEELYACPPGGYGVMYDLTAGGEKYTVLEPWRMGQNPVIGRWRDGSVIEEPTVVWKLLGYDDPEDVRELA